MIVALAGNGDFVGSVFRVILGAIGILVLFVVYFLPSFIADRRQVVNKSQVRVVNLFLGLSFIGWVVALVMAFSPNVED